MSGQEGRIKLKSDFCTTVPNLEALINHVYPDVQNISRKSIEWISERAILAPTNESADEINQVLMENFMADEMIFKAIDTVVDKEDACQFPVEFLNSLNVPGIPSYSLKLKVGLPVILMRNIKPPRLCNGTRLRVRKLNNNVVEAEILTGCGLGETVFIPRIPLIPTDYPVNFRRIQFPLKPCLAMTLNKAQGQTMRIVGLDLRNDCFSHGQLYVGMSRVSAAKNLFILPKKDEDTLNVVYKEVLN